MTLRDRVVTRLQQDYPNWVSLDRLATDLGVPRCQNPEDEEEWRRYFVPAHELYMTLMALKDHGLVEEMSVVVDQQGCAVSWHRELIDALTAAAAAPDDGANASLMFKWR